MAAELLPRLLGRGVIAGGLAGLISGGFAFFVTEPVMDRAVELEGIRSAAEEAAAGAAAHEHAEEVFTRTEQHFGLILASVGAGVALGILFAAVYWAVFSRTASERPWQRALTLAGAAFTGFWLLPFVRYPANPPGVGDEGSLTQRTVTWAAAIVIGLAAVFVAWRVNAALADKAPHIRQLATGAVPVVGLGVLFLLPANPDELPVPPDLLWDFRILAAASAVILWTSLGVLFGLLGLRAAAPTPAPAPATAPAAA
ncbi:CbtA family protein [Actinocorallia sp. API 0066]|uniref:CbtA family protein n=1 Tax=Actinocorallia sp. API 0066 TaxID=2896846 RepID=UPI001E417DF5|nr:CbtA family protein [Actinocorallia sp. API 0066]MCD0448304.1 CbtA family protein [Actinocorallia sp. API 0066]